jgi:hypothetical protein
MDWMEKPAIYADRIASCSANQVLAIEAWDLS